MKKILILLLFISTISFAQVTPSRSVRIANSTTAFGETIPRGTIITDATTGKVYSAFLGLASTKTIATCTLNSELIDLTGIQNTTVQQTSANFNIDGNGVIGGAFWHKGISAKFDLLIGSGTRYVVTDQYGNLGGGSTVIPTITKGSYTPTVVNVSGATSVDFDRALFTEIGGMVHVKISGTVTNISTGTVVISLTLPPSLNFNGNDLYVVGKGVVDENSQINITSGLVRYLSSTEVTFTFVSATTGGKEYCIDFDYSSN